jgi:hypothetical protein
VHGLPRRQVSEPERQGLVQCLRKRQVSILRRQHELYVMSRGQGTGAYRPGFVCDLLRRKVLSLRGWCELPSVREELLPRRVRPEELQRVSPARRVSFPPRKVPLRVPCVRRASTPALVRPVVYRAPQGSTREAAARPPAQTARWGSTPPPERRRAPRVHKATTNLTQAV